jgi:myosin heavy subunit
LGLSSDFDNTFTPSQSHQQLQQPYSTLSRSQSALQSNISNETSRSQQAQSQIQSESQAIAELEKQVQQQKEKLEKIKHAADEAEKQLESEKKKKEKLIEELQMYRQEIKHFKIRAENAQDEIEQIKNDTKELEEEKSKLSSPKSSLSPKANPQKDVFTLSSTGGGVFAKVHDDHSSVTASSPESVHSMPTQKIFDPFAGFKASSQSATSSPTVTLNRLKEGAGSRMSATIDISEIESKFPDLNTMEQSFAAAAPPPSPPAGSSPQPTKQQIPELPSKQTPDLTTSLTQETKPKNESVSKYGFDVSAFESPSTTTNTNNLFGLSVKDDLSSIFESPSANSNASAATNLSVFDDVFSSSTAKDNNTSNTTSFEDVFFKK